MTEREYIRATNRVKVTNALQIMRDVMPGDEYGISEVQKSEITRRLADAENRLFYSYTCVADTHEESNEDEMN